MVSALGSIVNQTIDLLQQRKIESLEKMKNGEAEEAILTGGNAFTETVWNKMLENVDEYLDEVKEEQKIRFAKMDEEQEEKERLKKRLIQEEMQAESNMKELLLDKAGGTLNVPYGYLVEDAKYQMIQQVNETLEDITQSMTSVTTNQRQNGDEVTAEQIAELFRDKE